MLTSSKRCALRFTPAPVGVIKLTPLSVTTHTCASTTSSATFNTPTPPLLKAPVPPHTRPPDSGSNDRSLTNAFGFVDENKVENAPPPGVAKNVTLAVVVAPTLSVADNKVVCLPGRIV